MPHRLLHLSDLHLDRAFAGMGCHGELARRRRQGLRDALRRAGDAARERDCDAICIGGDLYEHDRAGEDTARFLAETFASWQPTPVLIAPGNHDALIPGSIYARTEWPSNVHLFTSETMAPVEISEMLTIWGLAHREPQWQGDPLDCTPVPRDGVHIALFHGAELGSRPDDKSIHGPFRAADIHRRGFSAALCGHYHRRRLDTATGLLYPGTPEPLGFDEPGARGPAIVDIDGAGGVTFTALDTNLWQAIIVDADVDGAQSLDTVVDVACERTTTALAGVDPEHALVRVDLAGDIASAVGLDLITVETRLREQSPAALIRVRDLTRPTVDIATAMAERTTRGAFARAVADTIAATDAADEVAVLEDALRYGLMALSGAEVGLR